MTVYLCRLNQDVAALELQPTLEDVFHADTTSVEDYLQQIQDMTILTAIQVHTILKAEKCSVVRCKLLAISCTETDMPQ